MNSNFRRRLNQRSTPALSLGNCYPDHLFRSARRMLHRIALGYPTKEPARSGRRHAGQFQLAKGDKGTAESSLRRVRARTADGPPQRIKDMSQQHLPGDEALFIGEHRTSGEKKYYLANLPHTGNLRTMQLLCSATPGSKVPSDISASGGRRFGLCRTS